MSSGKRKPNTHPKKAERSLLLYLDSMCYAYELHIKQLLDMACSCGLTNRWIHNLGQ